MENKMSKKKTYTNEEKLNFFKVEYNYMKDANKKEFLKELITSTPDYFFNIEASSTGKYHPKYTTKEHGLVLHTRAVMNFVRYMTEIEQCTFSDTEKDLLMISAFVHDTLKRGNPETRYTVANHPLLAAERVRTYRDTSFNKYISNSELNYIANAVASHMGQWNTDYNGNEILPKPETEAQKLLHLADYLASQKTIEFNFDKLETKPTSYDKEKFLKLYNDEKTINEIGIELGMDVRKVETQIINLYKNGEIGSIDRFINPERESQIITLASDSKWDGYLRSIKSKIPEADYMEIQSVICKHHLEREKRKREKGKFRNTFSMNKYYEMFEVGKTIQEIADRYDVSRNTVENNILRYMNEHSDCSVSFDAFIDSKYESMILNCIPKDWDGKLRIIKDLLPEGVSYTCIKAVLLKHHKIDTVK